MKYDLASLSVELPEDILKKKWAGDFSGALAAIDARLQKKLPTFLRDRLVLERELLPRMERGYPHNKEKAMAIMQGLIPEFTEAEFDALVTLANANKAAINALIKAQKGE